MKIESTKAPVSPNVFHAVSLEARDVLRITFPSGAIVIVAPETDAIIVQRFEQDHESMVAVNAPLVRADQTRRTIAMCAPHVLVQQLESCSFKM
ncbi:hypothetical protein FOC84_10685 [Achromobacter pestifer]|uniref:Uncharacterized protein n=1 Tax=Achromobacter pestifer TaxID=1353889 RepID=A0A7D4I7B6_9BURK|nr:hypothetical protein [Achromobacter pestifer]QKH35382.1 hypothetical protein FOC84_10685 [Achromobacter pestifer]